MLGILFIGDIVGRPGRSNLADLIGRVKRKQQVDLVVANGENSAGGTGITREVADEIFRAGVDIITGGNHIWDKREALDLLMEERRIVRPANYPEGTPGQGFAVVEAGLPPKRILVINACGRTFMPPMEDPFRVVDDILKHHFRHGDIVLVDFHAEATSEKAALAWHLDGRVTAVLGTHTHVQTADERLLPKGTAFLSDVGMVGPANSILGVEPEPVLYKFLTGLPARFEVATGPVIFNAAYLQIGADGKALKPPLRISELIDS